MRLNSLDRSKWSKQQRKRLYHSLVLVGVGCLFTLMVVLVQPFHGINLWLTGQFFTSEEPSPNVVIAGIDDDTLETYGRWSEWPRSLHAQAIDNLNKAGARVIGYDVIFVDSSPDDLLLSAAMANANNVVLATVGTQILSGPGPEITYEHFMLPVAPLEQASVNIGHANVPPDPDGTVRRLPLVVSDEKGQKHASLSLAVLHTLFSMPLPDEFPLENGTVNLLARDIPVDDMYRIRINFVADNESYPYVSYGDIISGDFDYSLVKNKTILIGMTATGEPDTWAIPTSASKVPGVLIHVAAMDTILRQRFLIEPGIVTTMLIMLSLVGILAVVLPRSGSWYAKDIVKGVVVTVGLFVAYLVATFLAFDRGYILNVLYPLLTLPVVYVSSVLYVTVMEQSDKRFIKELFGRYISPQIAREIVSQADSGELHLGGEEREITVFFADIRNFTSLSEQMSPEDLVKTLNVYLTIMVDAVVENGGLVNKFIGDNVMAIWNAPQSQPGHAMLAVKAAWEAQQKVAELDNSESDSSSLPVLRWGIGINTGNALAGNVGSAKRAEYTVIGDTVNLAARICGGAPGGDVWISDQTYDQVKEYLDVEEMERQNFKGKSTSTQVYRVKGLRPAKDSP